MKHDLPEVRVVHPGCRRQCTSYLIKGRDGAVLVDPGCGAFEDELFDGIRTAGVEVRQIHHVLLTHCHFDHTLGAGRLRDRGMKLAAHPRTAEILRDGGHQVWYEYPGYVIPAQVDITPADGDVMTLSGIDIRVLYTPGHTDGCASYMVETNEGLAVFTGDLLVCTTTDGYFLGHVGWAGDEGFSAEASLRSVEKLLACNPARAYSGHGVVSGPAMEWLELALGLGREGEWKLHTEFYPQQGPLPCMKPRAK